MTRRWRGRALSVELLYSVAGVATQIALRADGRLVLLDCGDGTLRALRGELDTLAGVVISHGHFDHMGGVWSLLGGLRCVGRRAPLTVLAPAGCAELEAVLDGFETIYGDTLSFALTRTTPAPGVAVQLGPFEVTPFEVVHAGSIAGHGPLPRVPAYGYTIERDGERVVYSGDTAPCPALEAAVRGADLALIEATFVSRRSAVHLCRAEAEAVGRGAREHWLIHPALDAAGEPI